MCYILLDDISGLSSDLRPAFVVSPVAGTYSKAPGLGDQWGLGRDHAHMRRGRSDPADLSGKHLLRAGKQTVCNTSVKEFVATQFNTQL
jgi:hypothetical protein